MKDEIKYGIDEVKNALNDASYMLMVQSGVAGAFGGRAFCELIEGHYGLALIDVAIGTFIGCFARNNYKKLHQNTNLLAEQNSGLETKVVGQ